jgi:hypothetical protein
MSKAIRKAAADHPPIITVGELIDELCRLPDTAFVSFRCPALEHELTYYRLRKRSKDIIEIEVNVYPESPAIVPAADSAFGVGRQANHAHAPRESAILHKARG